MALSRGSCARFAVVAIVVVVWVALGVVPPQQTRHDTPAQSADLESLSGPRIASRGKAPWQIGRPSAAPNVTEAYAERPSYLPGETLRVAVSTTAKTFDLSIWRLGATPVQMLASRPISGGVQTRPVVDLSSGLVRATWRTRYGLKIPATWTSGIYLIRVHGIGGADNFATFVLRSTRASSLLFVVNTLTDAAYNRWGGASLYWLNLPGARVPVAHAVAVSLDRPNSLGDGAGSTFTQTWPLARWLEQSGYDVTYTTDWDLSRAPDAAPLPRALVFAGHSEYWSPDLRTWLDRHIIESPDMGLALFGANTGYWPVTISADGRTITCYKEALTDPGYATPLPSEATAPPSTIPSEAPTATLRPTVDPRQPLRFRDGGLGNIPANRRPEQDLFGVQYGSITTDIHQFFLSQTVPWDLLAGTDLFSGQRLGGIIGGETDAVDWSLPIPGHQTIIATALFNDVHNTPTSANAVYRTLPGDRAVFAAGTFLWMWGLDPAYARVSGVPDGFVRLTRNILAGVTGEAGPSAPVSPSPFVSPSASAPAG